MFNHVSMDNLTVATPNLQSNNTWNRKELEHDFTHYFDFDFM